MYKFVSRWKKRSFVSGASNQLVDSASTPVTSEPPSLPVRVTTSQTRPKRQRFHPRPTMLELAWEQTKARVLLSVSVTVDGGFMLLWYFLTLKLSLLMAITRLSSVLDQAFLNNLQWWSSYGTLGIVILMIIQDFLLFAVEVLISFVEAIKRLWYTILK